MFSLRNLLHQARYVRPIPTLKLHNYCTQVTKESGDDFSETKRRDNINRHQLKTFGGYVFECLPKYIQKVQMTYSGELEILVVPEGILCAIQFLKDHHNCQFEVMSEITSIDVPCRVYRFELIYNLLSLRFNSRIRVSFILIWISKLKYVFR